MALAYRLLPQIESLQNAQSIPSIRTSPQSHIWSAISRLPPDIIKDSNLATTVLKLYQRYQSQSVEDPTLKVSEISPGSQQNDQDEAAETCEICNANIKLVSVQWARCEANHQFGKN